MGQAIASKRRWSPVEAGNGRAAPGIPDFPALLGSAAWNRLAPAIRQRFAPHAHASARTTTYRGCMRVEASLLGRCFAHLCRCIGTPVAPYVHDAVPVVVRVIDRPDASGTLWERIYEFPDRQPTIVSSIKRLEHPGKVAPFPGRASTGPQASFDQRARPGGMLVEALGCGLRMSLDVFESDGALHFLSTDYFFQLGRLRIRLPDWLPPGVTHVIHEDLGDGSFRFSMRTEHACWGEMYRQSGLFI